MKERHVISNTLSSTIIQCYREFFWPHIKSLICLFVKLNSDYRITNKSTKISNIYDNMRNIYKSEIHNNVKHTLNMKKNLQHQVVMVE